MIICKYDLVRASRAASKFAGVFCFLEPPLGLSPLFAGLASQTAFCTILVETSYLELFRINTHEKPWGEGGALSLTWMKRWRPDSHLTSKFSKPSRHDPPADQAGSIPPKATTDEYVTRNLPYLTRRTFRETMQTLDEVQIWIWAYRVA
jgi:hypothetical protein